MEVVFGLVSLTVAKLFQFSGLLDNRNVLRSRKMEEKALEVYGEDVQLSILVCITMLQLISTQMLRE